MVEVRADGRSDKEAFFTKSGLLAFDKLDHNPYLAFVATDSEVRVLVVRTTKALLELPDDVPVMQQWPGQWRSDFFKFTVGDVRAAMEARNAQ